MTAFTEKSGAGTNAGGALEKENNEEADSPVASSAIPRVAVLTAGRDKPYALGLASALMAQGETFDFLGSDIVDSPDLHEKREVNFLNLRNQQAEAGLFQKIFRILVYYVRLMIYALRVKPRIFHILWNNKFELFDRTVLMVYYKLLGKKIVFTAHNVNAGIRDGNDSFLNRLSLKFQYRLSDHIFVHTEMMKSELVSGFAVPSDKVRVIPFGINNTVPNTDLTREAAKRQLGIRDGEPTLLFFGHITPYKGLEYLIEAFTKLAKKSGDYRLIIAGGVKECEDYWSGIQKMISSSGLSDRIIQRIEFIPDDQTEIYFKAADVLILPYTHIFQSGVLFLGYSFGLPAISTDVGSLKEEIIDGKTGFVCPPKDSAALASVIETYFSSDLYKSIEYGRQEISEYANERYSWAKVAVITRNVYSKLGTKRMHL
ncbi:MAG TPA: glycosyltransferase family 4 protein [Verrucomicrobiae bacterium]|nr:glycosyltransferase family 4 protein [Verrucomicrobiae bacterium]